MLHKQMFRGGILLQTSFEIKACLQVYNRLPKKGQSYPEPISLILGQPSPAAQILTDIYNIPAGRLMPRTS
ncbi:hypothetical protein M726_06060 [Neisseria gonorrhoeae ATL_2011_01_17]|nr:predicted protein [Neisseria gonorrhoeae PID332]KLR80842.1 hypothetical protein M680_07810 [Neisseria gonorrhoeae SK8976]KLR96930.1 hypothetical protein M674_02070 [Neisseria gonorrhoeae SK708]KLS11574.1 hypothetical protein M726_06060 [Neisseria gonorrhoeae ATL_2011_01_17]GFL30130.1 hypothetical protein TUM15760_12920 [Neisseria gonorrhoeae]